MKKLFLASLCLLPMISFATSPQVLIKNIRALDPLTGEAVATFNGSSTCYEGFKREIKVDFTIETQLESKYITTFCTVYNLRNLNKAEYVGACSPGSLIFTATDSCGEYLFAISAYNGYSSHVTTTNLTLTFWQD